MNEVKEARKEMYRKLRSDNPHANKQILKNMAYDLTQEAAKNLSEKANG